MAGRPKRRARLAAQAAQASQASRFAPAVEPAPNSRTVNRAIAEAGIPVTLHKGNGYFYIEAADGTQVDSIYVPYWDDFSVSEWVEQVRYEYEQAHPQPLYVGGPARKANPATVEDEARAALATANMAMDRLSAIKRALYAEQPSWSTANRLAAGNLYTPALRSEAHEVEMAVHAARDAGTPVRPVVKDLAFDVQVAVHRAARSANALCTLVISHRGSGDLPREIATALDVAERDIYDAHRACAALFSAAS